MPSYALQVCSFPWTTAAEYQQKSPPTYSYLAPKQAILFVVTKHLVSDCSFGDTIVKSFYNSCIPFILADDMNFQQGLLFTLVKIIIYANPVIRVFKVLRP